MKTILIAAALAALAMDIAAERTADYSCLFSLKPRQEAGEARPVDLSAAPRREPKA